MINGSQREIKEPGGSPGIKTSPAMTDHTTRRRQIAALSVIVFGLVLAATLSRWMDAHRPPERPQTDAEELYVTPEAAKRLSLGFNGLVADWYWMRSLQYVGRKIIAYQGDVQIDDLGPLNLNLLAPLLDHTTTLDPQFMAAYEFGAMVLPAVDEDAAIKLIRKGIAANPQAWRLYSQLGYIYWQHGLFREASAAYGAGARLPGAPAWMQAMAAQMEIHGGSREVARAIYIHLFEQSEDEQVKQMALKHLMQLKSLDERDLIRRALAEFRDRQGRCPAAWREVTPALRVMGFSLDRAGAPLDPSNVPYVLVRESCDVSLDARSEIMRK